ncbi:hypothetical protein IMZ68_02000 [Candidatus Bathyarchaeota archaeon]|nr:hypothetical protein [Candidatus Bathyarchaeota archaeon]
MPPRGLKSPKKNGNTNISKNQNSNVVYRKVTQNVIATTATNKTRREKGETKS